MILFEAVYELGFSDEEDSSDKEDCSDKEEGIVAASVPSGRGSPLTQSPQPIYATKTVIPSVEAQAKLSSAVSTSEYEFVIK